VTRKPLQTHGRLVETWNPPADRFCQYEQSDRDWVEFFGFAGGGTYGEPKLVDLYDVRDLEENLVGYTDHNPADCRWGGMHVPVMTETPVSIWGPDLGFARREDQVIQEVQVNIMSYAVTVRVDRDGQPIRHCFDCWVINIMDAPKLAVCGWLKCLGEDNIHKFASDLHRQAFDYQRRHPTLVDRFTARHG
jgi:hypothetical protein